MRRMKIPVNGLGEQFSSLQYIFFTEDPNVFEIKKYIISNTQRIFLCV